MDNREKIKEVYENYVNNANLFWEKNNASAGARARKALMELKKLAHEERTAIQEKKNA